MSKTPFRIAFWSLSLSFAMLVTLSIINPNHMRTGLYKNEVKVVAVADWIPVEQSSTLVSTTEVEPTLAAAYETDYQAIAENEPTPAEAKEAFPGTQPQPIMVADASGDFRRDIGGLYPIADSEASIAPAPTLKAEQTDVFPETPSKAVLVPEPHYPALEPVGEVVSSPAHKTDDHPHTGLLLKKIASLQSDVAAIKAAAIVAPPLSALRVEPERSYSISNGNDEGRWSFEFEETELATALRVLGEQIGWKVVVAEAVDGLVTAQFNDADPEQAFAVLVKSHHCAVSRRGDYILIEQHDSRYSPR